MEYPEHIQRAIENGTGGIVVMTDEKWRELWDATEKEWDECCYTILMCRGGN